ncbi:hypothetical protein GCM10010191_30510 [Actinomadura vinacea]|uniref:Uncharacterized protein n=1 Tax=Actinomadura vinacea TaxID=115336 RepID=A0ABN3J0B5_9ACTN
MTDDLIATRRALHGVAENVLAGAQYRQSGTIRLVITPGGFGTISDPALRIAGTELIAGERAIPVNGTTCGGLGTTTDIEAGAPQGLYEEGSGVQLDDVLSVDAGAAAYLEECFERGDAALRRFAPDLTPVLWPEHFDLGITLDEVNYGVSPGDGYLDEPYAYAGPWRQRSGSFWNTPFGAARPLRDLSGPNSIHDFLTEARVRAASAPLINP